MPLINLGKKKTRDGTFNKAALQSFYNTPRWKRLRKFKMMNDPLCENCEDKGIIRQADEVHHVKPIDIINPNEEDIYDYDNLKSVCKECHVLFHSFLNRGLNPIESIIAARREVR